MKREVERKLNSGHEMDIENELRRIQERNRKVETDKAWETSNTRKVILAGITYILIGLYMTYLEVGKPWLNALVPTAGFLISTLTLAWIKNIWTKKHMK